MEPIKTSKKILKRELGGTSRLISEYFGPISYTYLIYLIFAFNICMFIILFFRENKFYRKFDDTEIDINLGTNIFYIYIFTIFLILFQLYILKTNEEIIYEDISYFQIFIEIFNYISIIGLSYYFYKQIDQIDEGCASPRERVCVANTSEGNPNDIDDCPNGSYACVNPNEIPWRPDSEMCGQDLLSEECDFMNNNFVLLQGTTSENMENRNCSWTGPDREWIDSCNCDETASRIITIEPTGLGDACPPISETCGPGDGNCSPIVNCSWTGPGRDWIDTCNCDETVTRTITIQAVGNIETCPPISETCGPGDGMCPELDINCSLDNNTREFCNSNCVVPRIPNPDKSGRGTDCPLSASCIFNDNPGDDENALAGECHSADPQFPHLCGNKKYIGISTDMSAGFCNSKIDAYYGDEQDKVCTDFYYKKPDTKPTTMNAYTQSEYEDLPDYLICGYSRGLEAGHCTNSGVRLKERKGPSFYCDGLPNDRDQLCNSPDNCDSYMYRYPLSLIDSGSHYNTCETIEGNYLSINVSECDTYAENSNICGENSNGPCRKGGGSTTRIDPTDKLPVGCFKSSEGTTISYNMGVALLPTEDYHHSNFYVPINSLNDRKELLCRKHNFI